MTNANEFFLVKRGRDAEGSSRRTPTAFVYCDLAGKVLTVDYTGSGSAARSVIEACGDVIVARYPSERHVVLLGIAGGNAVNPLEDARRVQEEMAAKGIGLAAIQRIEAAYRAFRGGQTPEQPSRSTARQSLGAQQQVKPQNG